MVVTKKKIKDEGKLECVYIYYGQFEYLFMALIMKNEKLLLAVFKFKDQSKKRGGIGSFNILKDISGISKIIQNQEHMYNMEYNIFWNHKQ